MRLLLFTLKSKNLQRAANRTTEGDSKAFNVKVGLHQESVLSPLLFVIVMEMISRELQAGDKHGFGSRRNRCRRWSLYS